MVIANKGDNDDAEFLLPVKYKSLFQMLKLNGYILCRTKKWKDGNIVEKNTSFLFFSHHVIVVLTTAVGWLRTQTCSMSLSTRKIWLKSVKVNSGVLILLESKRKLQIIDNKKKSDRSHIVVSARQVKRFAQVQRQRRKNVTNVKRWGSLILHLFSLYSVAFGVDFRKGADGIIFSSPKRLQRNWYNEVKGTLDSRNGRMKNTFF